MPRPGRRATDLRCCSSTHTSEELLDLVQDLLEHAQGPAGVPGHLQGVVGTGHFQDVPAVDACLLGDLVVPGGVVRGAADQQRGHVLGAQRAADGVLAQQRRQPNPGQPELAGDR